MGTGNSANTTANSNTAANTNTALKTEASKPTLKSEKRPEGTAKTVKKNPVPADWTYVYDEDKGYGFALPAGSEGETDTIEGVDVFSATTPAPSKIDVFVLAYKDGKRTKEDLLNDAVEFLEGLGQKIIPGQLKAESDVYAVADASTVDP